MDDTKIDGEKVVHAGFTKKQLESAFNLVKPKGNWKNPIDAVIDNDVDLALLDAAVVFFTGSQIDCRKAADGKIRVVAKGYYLTIGS